MRLVARSGSKEFKADLRKLTWFLGHSSIQTTERYVAAEQEIAVTVNDSVRL